MDTTSIEIPAAEPVRGIGMRLAGAALAATAIAALGAGYVLGQANVSPATAEPVSAIGDGQTWDQALRESVVLKQRATGPAAELDIRQRRIEK